MEIALILTLGVCFVSLLAFFYFRGQKSYSCNHDYEVMHHTSDPFFDRILFKCKECGKLKKKQL